MGRAAGPARGDSAPGESPGDSAPAVISLPSRELVVFLKRPGGQSQFSAPLSLQNAGERFADLHAWIAATPSRRLTLAILADQVGMSERSFARHYRRRTGHTPAEGVDLIRVEHAKGLLEAGASVSLAASRSGFGTAETMRRSFLKRLGVGPRDWRERFRI